jgi:hypothetical protein
MIIMIEALSKPASEVKPLGTRYLNGSSTFFVD